MDIFSQELSNLFEKSTFEKKKSSSDYNEKKINNNAIFETKSSKIATFENDFESEKSEKNSKFSLKDVAYFSQVLQAQNNRFSRKIDIESENNF
ncbi:MAG: hypothetical protein RSA99_04025 [Oscillospiraceae bacterium]